MAKRGVKRRETAKPPREVKTTPSASPSLDSVLATKTSTPLGNVAENFPPTSGFSSGVVETTNSTSQVCGFYIRSLMISISSLIVFLINIFVTLKDGPPEGPSNPGYSHNISLEHEEVTVNSAGSGCVESRSKRQKVFSG